MRIGIVTEHYYPSLGGIQEHVHHFAREMSRRGHKVTIVTSRMDDVARAANGESPAGDAQAPGRVVRMGGSRLIFANGSFGRVSTGLLLARRLRRRLLDEAFDVVHVHSPLDPVLPLLGVHCAPGPVVGTFHTNFPADPVRRFAYRAMRPWLRRLDAAVAVSRACVRALEAVVPGARADYRVIPNGVDVDYFAAGRPLPAFDDGRFNILFVGRVEPRKGARYLVEAYAKLKQRHPETRLIVCGRGPELGDLRELVHREHVSDVLFAGRVSETDKARFYKTADVFCAPSTGQESFGIVLLEAMAAGTAAIASDIHGYKKVIQRNLSGLLVEPRDVDALCSALERLVTEPALRNQLGERGSIRAREFDWSHVTDQLLAFYDRVIRAYRSA